MIKSISSENCFKQLNSDPNSYLIDVRTPMEWSNHGMPDEDAIEGVFFKLMLINEDGIENINFVNEFNSLEIPKDSNIYLICRSGARSLHAASIIEAEGYQNLFNVEDGFVMGWLPKGLPSVEY